MRAKCREQHQERVETGPALLPVMLLTAAVATAGPGPLRCAWSPGVPASAPPALPAHHCYWLGRVGPHCSAFVDRLLLSHAPVTRRLSSRPAWQGLGCIFSSRHKENWCLVSNTAVPRVWEPAGEGSFPGLLGVAPEAGTTPKERVGALHPASRVRAFSLNGVSGQTVPPEGAVPLEVPAGNIFTLLGCPRRQK